MAISSGGATSVTGEVSEFETCRYLISYLKHAYISQYMLLQSIFRDATSENLHPRKVTVYSGNDSRHVQKVEISKGDNATDVMDVHVTSINSQPMWRPRELDIEIDFQDEHGQARALVVYFHKGETFVKWIYK